MKWCNDCGREKRKGHFCDMAELDNGHVVHASRIDIMGDVRERIDKGEVKVINRWIKREPLRKPGR